MNYFVLVCATIFLGVMLYLDVLKHFLGNEAYWEGLHIVPILLFANIFLGIFYNLSVWYKLSGKTQYGAIIASLGALITLVLNLILEVVFLVGLLFVAITGQDLRIRALELLDLTSNLALMMLKKLA